MRKLLLFLSFLMIISCVQSYGFNIARRWGCDTIFMRGNYAQLKQIEANIMSEMKKPVDPLLKGELYALMGQTQETIGNWKEALKWYNRAVAYFEDIDYAKPGNAGERYYYAMCLISYSDLQYSLGMNTAEVAESYGKAVDVFYSWLSYADRNAGKDKADAARLLYGNARLAFVLANMSTLMREFSTAVKECEEGIGILRSDVFGQNLERSMEYGQILAIMADIYERASNREQALERFKEAREVIEKVSGKNSVHYAAILGRIGGVYYTLNDLATASEYFMESLGILKKLGFTAHPQYAVSLNGMGMVLLNLGLWKEADEFLQLAYRICCEACGQESFMAAVCKFTSVYSTFGQGNFSRAWEEILALYDNPALQGNIASDHFLGVMVLASDLGLVQAQYNEVIDMYKNIEMLLDVYRNVGSTHRRNVHISVGRAYRRNGDYGNAVGQFGKAVDIQRSIAHDDFRFLTEEQRSKLWELDKTRINSIFALNTGSRQHSEAISGLLYDVALLNKGLLLQASINLAEVVSNSGDEALKKKFSDFALLKQELAAKGEGESRESEKMEQEIVAQARKYGDFMDYVNITWRDVKGAMDHNDVAIEFVSSEYAGVCTYSAEVLRKDMDSPVHIKLFSIPVSGKSQLHAGNGRYSPTILQKLWSRELLEMLPEGGDVYFVPVGELYNIGIEYIPLADGVRMCDRYRMHRLSSTREIVSSHKNSAVHSCTLFGGLNYDTSLSDMELYAYASRMRGGKSFSFTPDNLSGYTSWGYLPGTVEEVNSISGTLAGSGYKVTAFTGSEGVEETFKALSGSRTPIIHIATHGFYLPNKGDALENSGLVFAGANNFWNAAKGGGEMDFDDGILTAREISYLNLQGTDLVVMSACQTGLGEVTGEGVFGLQRAFKKAGVQTLLMSLWEVDDEATRIMMSEFYKALMQGAGKRDALEQAQNCVKQHTFIRNGKEVSGNDPYYWAAFVMMD